MHPEITDPHAWRPRSTSAQYDGHAPPLVSIITRTFNRAHILPRAVRSVRRQTFTNFELILVDDSSTDHTPAVIGALQAEDARIGADRLHYVPEILADYAHRSSPHFDDSAIDLSQLVPEMAALLRDPTESR